MISGTDVQKEHAGLNTRMREGTQMEQKKMVTEEYAEEAEVECCMTYDDYCD